ncbi:hypothetical protein [Algoriphagus sp. PAP.12]|uniref:hypothetical protein n=1 Tax=Algoriphagus sp. PAP.12 TaxID=2996678 RepID=UPI00227C9AB8|nr:hypothetical protein [Algoriphagus sp. PAP.12]
MKVFKKEITDNFWVELIPASPDRKEYLLYNETLSGQGDYWDINIYKREKLKGIISFAVKDGKANSLPKAPFGGFWMEEQLHSEEADFFLQSMEYKLKSIGVIELSITQAPKPYQASQDLFSYLLFKNGYQCQEVLAHQFYVGKKKLKKLTQNDQPKVAKKVTQNKLQITCHPVQNFSFLEEIRHWNRSRGYEINLDESRLINQVSEFPECYHLISIWQNETPVAHTLGVKLTPKSLYYFQSAIDPKVSIKNLGEVLLMRLFQLAVDLKVDFVDLGSSDLEKDVNHSLMFFKSKFSNDVSNKLTWKKAF